VTSLGLVQMTRKRVGQGLVETFSTTCEHCHGRGMTVDMDGEGGHTHPGGSGGGDEGGKSSSSSSSSRRRGRRGRGGAKDEGEQGAENGGEEQGGDVHRLADDEDSRALARATIASIAAASGSHAQPEVVVDGQVVEVEQASGQDAAEGAAPSEG
jgi:ribonuclease E